MTQKFPFIPENVSYLFIVIEKCVKRECNYNYDCKLGDKCDGGFCKPIPGFCLNDNDCDKDQCCAKAGDNKSGLCKNMTKPGEDWCPLKVRKAPYTTIN